MFCCFGKQRSEPGVAGNERRVIVNSQPPRGDGWEKGFKFVNSNLVLRIGTSRTEVSLNKKNIIDALAFFKDSRCMSTELRQQDKFTIQRGKKSYELSVSCQEISKGKTLDDATKLNIIIAPESKVSGDDYANENVAIVEFDIKTLKEKLGISENDLAAFSEECVRGFNVRLG